MPDDRITVRAAELRAHLQGLGEISEVMRALIVLGLDAAGIAPPEREVRRARGSDVDSRILAALDALSDKRPTVVRQLSDTPRPAAPLPAAPPPPPPADDDDEDDDPFASVVYEV